MIYHSSMHWNLNFPMSQFFLSADLRDVCCWVTIFRGFGFFFSSSPFESERMAHKGSSSYL